MEDARTSISSKQLTRTFETLIESPEAEISSIPIVRPEPFPTGNNRDIPVSVQELVYGSKAAGVGASSKSFDRKNELISSSKEAHGPRKERGASEGLETHVLQRTSTTDKSLVENPKHFVRGPEEEVSPRKVQKPCGSSSSLNKCQTRTRKLQRAIRRERKSQRERRHPSGKGFSPRITDFQRKKRQPWTMCSI
ncbi:hypothetical protein O181_130807 [Austropuccinia psidii MF-1]|uniref:Uncharacterized protein n=1 Tax=Austropuccinia psidii MF-1 TaxID=1389203 RepID=A0A9Q3L4H5_9BASI|nr:hypothetical protein [Austropuccinia psidii MF-1]